MGKFDGLLSGFNSSFFPTLSKGREANTRKQQAAAAQKLAQDRLGLQQDNLGLRQDAFGLQQDKFDAYQSDKKTASGLAQEERDQKVNQDLGRALSIQNAVEEGAASGNITPEQRARINAAGGGDEQSALLNTITAENQELSRNAPMQDLEQQRLIAGIESDQALTQQRNAASSNDPAKPNDIRLLAELGLEPTLENLAQVRSAGGPEGAQAKPITVGAGQTLVDPSTGKEIYKAPPKQKGDKPTTKQINETSKANVSFEALTSNLTKLDGLIAEHGGEQSPGKVRDQMMQHQKTAMLEAKELFNLGVLNGPDMEILESLLVSPTPEGIGRATSIMREGAAALGFGDTLQDRSRASIASFLEQAGERVDSVRAQSGDAPMSASAGADAQGFTTSAGGNKYKVVQ